MAYDRYRFLLGEAKLFGALRRLVLKLKLDKQAGKMSQEVSLGKQARHQSGNPKGETPHQQVGRCHW